MFGKRGLRVLAAAIMLVMLLSATQVVGGGEERSTVADTRAAEYVKVGWLGSVYSWNPLTIAMVEDYVVCYLIYSALFTYDEDWGGPVNDLASGYWQEVHPNGSMTTYINITTNAYFRGIDNPTDTSHPLTALDVAWTFNLIKNNTGGTFDWYFEDISYVTAHEQVPGSGVYDQVRFWCPYQKATLIDDISAVPILPQYHWEANGFDDRALSSMNPENQIGSGPFMFESYLKDSWYKFKTAPNYHGEADYGSERSVEVPGILYTVFVSTAAMCIELDSGVLDTIVLSGDLNAFENAVGGDGASVNVIKAAVAENGITDIAINAIPNAFDTGSYLTRHPALLDPYVRQAIMMTLNKDFIVNDMLGGRPVMAASVIQPGYWQADIQNQLQFDPAAARAMLVANGWADGDGDGWLEATAGAYGVQQGWFPVGTELSGIRCQSPDTDPNYGMIARAWPGWADDAGIQLIGTIESETTMINKAWYAADYDIWIWHWGWGPEPIGGALCTWFSYEIEKGGDNCQMPMGPWWAHTDNYTDCPFISEDMIAQYDISNPSTWNGRFSAYDQNLTDAMRTLDATERKVILDKLQQWVYDSYTENPPYYDLGLYAFTDCRFVGWGNWEAHPGRTIASDLLWLWFDLEPRGDNLPPVFNVPLLPDYEVYAGEPVTFEIVVSDPDGDVLLVNWSFGDGASAMTTLTGDTTVPTVVWQNHTYPDPSSELQLEVTVSDMVPGHQVLSLSTVNVLSGQQTERHVGYWWHNMFNEPFGEWWEMRYQTYGNWEVVSDIYPYIYRTHAYNGPLTYYSNMRLNVASGGLTEVNTNNCPQFLPYLGEERGGEAVVDWYMQYLTEEEMSSFPEATQAWYDGWVIALNGTVVLDDQAAMAVLGVTAEGLEDFGSWWEQNNVTVNQAYLDWVKYEGGRDRLDIYNMYEYPLTFLRHSVWAERAGDNVVVHYDTVSWGMEALMTRWLHEAFMPTEWYFEDFRLHAEIHPEVADIDVDTAVVGAVFAWTDIATGIPSWAWRGMLQDYVPSSLAHPDSDFDAYHGLEYIDMYAGSPSYGEMIPFGYTPGAFNLSEGEEMWFEWPEGPQAFITGGGLNWFATTEYGIAIPYSEPSTYDLPANVAIDPLLRTITFEGPMDVYSWSRTQNTHAYLDTEWDRLGVLPYGMPWIQFRGETEPPSPSLMAIDGVPDPVTVGQTFGFTATVLDQYGMPYTDYNGTVGFSSSDTGAILPADYTYVAADGGTHYFEAAFSSEGEHSLTVTDLADPTLQTTLSNITVRAVGEAKLWTVMVYLDADNNLEDVGLTDFLEMSSVGSSEDVDIVVQLDRIPGYDNAFGDWTDTLRFHVTEGMTPEESNAVVDLGELNMGDPMVLADFIEWGTINYPADNYMLVLWDHGGGWNGAVCWDETDMWDALTMDEVEQALASAQSYTGERIDVLGYDACMMAMVEVMYETKEYVDYVVASEELVPWDGWPYDTIMGDLVSDPSMTPADLSSRVVSRYMEYYGQSGWETMSAVDILASGSMYSALDDFAQELLAALDEHKEIIRNCRANATQFMDWTAVDLYSFASMICDRNISESLTSAAGELMARISAAVIAEGHSYSYDPPGAYGVSIYFPYSSSDYWPNYEADLDFTADTSWDEFLVALLSIGPDAYEPDDAYTEATQLLVGETQWHSLHTAWDVDWFEFTLDAEDDVRIHTSNPTWQWEVLYMYLYDEYGVPYGGLAYDEGWGYDTLAVIDIHLGAGTYYVFVGSYEVTEAYEIVMYVGDIPNEPPVIGLDIYPWPYAGEPSTFDASYSYDPDGYIVSYEWDFGDGTAAEGVMVEHTYVEAGVYTLTLVITDDDGAQASFSFWLQVLEPAEPDQYEPDNTYDLASTMELGEVQEHSIAPGGGDIDWVTFTLTEETGVAIETSIPEWGDTVIALYDEDGVPDSWIAVDDDSGPGLSSRIVIGLQPGTYWIEIWSYGYWDEIPIYTLSLTEVEIVNEPPYAYIYWWPIEPSPGQEVMFYADAWDPDGYVTSCVWDFGNGSTAEGWSVNYSFAEEGYHIVTLTVTDNAGATTSVSETVFVHYNEAPVPILTYTPAHPAPGQEVYFDASGSYDPDGSILYYYFEFGDGDYEYTTSPYIWHTYYYEGYYTVTLGLYDSSWMWNSTSAVISVGGQAAPPVAIAAYEPSMPLVGETVVFDGSHSFDPDGVIVEYIWQFGDGDVAMGVIAEHVYEHEGTYQVKLTVMDGDLLVDEDIVYITVASVPVASMVYSPLNPSAGDLVTFYAYGSYDEGGIVEYVWSFGDGTYAIGWEASHVYDQRGIYEAVLTVTNIYGIQRSTSMTLTVDIGNSGVKGVVVSDNERPIKNALVELRLNGILVGSAQTDATGAFLLRDLAPGVYDLSISKRGYTTFTTTVTVGFGMLDLGTIMLESTSGGSTLMDAESDTVWFASMGAVLVIAAFSSVAVSRLKRTRTE